MLRADWWLNAVALAFVAAKVALSALAGLSFRRAYRG